MPTKEEKAARLRQRAKVIWLFGLSGAGKTTLAMALEDKLVASGFTTAFLDGDHLRNGLSKGLGFSEGDRTENLRRAGEVAKLFVLSGVIPICAFITPLRAQRALVQNIVGEPDVLWIHVSASLATCERRDPKGLYARAASGSISHVAGKDSPFEAPLAEEGVMVVDSEVSTVEFAASRLYGMVEPHLRL